MSLPDWFWPAIGGALVTLPIAMFGNAITPLVLRTGASFVETVDAVRPALAAHSVAKLEMWAARPQTMIIAAISRVFFTTYFFMLRIDLRTDSSFPPLVEALLLGLFTAVGTAWFIGFLCLVRSSDQPLLRAHRLIEKFGPVTGFVDALIIARRQHADDDP